MALGVVVALCLVAFAVFLFFCTQTDYRPQPVEEISQSEAPDTLRVGDSFSILSWNVGYAGLNCEMDFFYDGGKQVRPSYAQVEQNLSAIADFLGNLDTVSFFFLQEVDINAKRSYGINEQAYFSKALANIPGAFALNYKVGYVPLPLFHPMGRVNAGLSSFSRLQYDRCARFAYPYNFSWPLRVFMLDRCFLEMRFPTDNGKELVLINTHNSAFDEAGKLRVAELAFLRNHLLAEYDKGNYVIAGGDFNQSPVGLNPAFDGEVFDFKEFISIPDTLLPAEWHYVFDNSAPTNRRADEPYERGRTRVTLIDFFIASPNVEVRGIRCENLHFRHSDHNPIVGTFSLKIE